MVFLYLISKGCENMEKSLEQLKQEYEKTTVLLEREKRKMQRLKNDKVLSLVTAFLLPGNTGVVLSGRPDEMLRLFQLRLFPSVGVEGLPQRKKPV